jgi:hypothetical protein
VQQVKNTNQMKEGITLQDLTTRSEKFNQFCKSKDSCLELE